ncbi:MAG TPA: helix-turn-helix domain-containing protein [Ignavibacteria bacterium]|nr:helix-turn-helix domain-containing protein [Ignavibacteria bacterium]
MKNEIAEFVKSERKKLKYTQPEFARRTGVGLAFLRALEQGKTNLQLQKVIQILSMLNAKLIPAIDEEKILRHKNAK